MMKNYDNKPTSSALAASDERISVVKLSKSGGCVDRDPAFMKAVRESQIRSYFFGNPVPSTASSALSLSTSSSLTNVTLSPHASQLDINALSIYYYTVSDEDEDDYDPSQLGISSSSAAFLPGGLNNEPSSLLPGLTSSQNPTSSTTTTATEPSGIPLTKLTPPPPSTLASSLIAITHAPPNAPPAEIRDSSVMGFLYVADTIPERGRVRILAPVGGRVPMRAMIWGMRWPGHVIGLVG